jgi:hypothetical protein
MMDWLRKLFHRHRWDLWPYMGTRDSYCLRCRCGLTKLEKRQ